MRAEQLFAFLEPQRYSRTDVSIASLMKNAVGDLKIIMQFVFLEEELGVVDVSSFTFPSYF